MKATVQSVSVGGTGGVNGMNDAQLLALFSISPLSPSTVDTALTTSGQITWTFGAAANVFDYLTASDTLTLTYTVKVDDSSGGVDTQDVVITIHGVNEGITVLPPFTGTGDPNDNDAIGPAAGATVTFTTVSGNDDIYNGTNGNDTVNTGQGDDTAYGHDGHDAINGQQGGDTSLYGQAGNDTISGGQASDEIFGGSGDDTLYGGADTMPNGTANDTLYGGSGSDTIFGQDSDDLIIGGYGADDLTGNTGTDTFKYLSVLDRGDIIEDFEGANALGGDVIDLSAITTNFAGTTATANSAWYAVSGGDATVYVDTDGNAATAEFAITVKNVTIFNSGDFDVIP
jgi:Ca2+-binding RTX toxin-like protein